MASSGQIYRRRQRWAGILRGIIFLAGVYQIFFGERLVGFAILASLGAIMLPAWLTRGRIKALPLEFELILFIIVTLQFVIGETLNFYDKVPYYDKFTHFLFPFFIGYITAMLAYTMYVTGNLKMTVVPGMVIIVLMTLGIASLWEIIEYLSDKFLGTYLQGSMTSSPLVDTMNDLIFGLVGGIFGALIALRYIRDSQRNHDPRLSALTGEISADFGQPRQK